jgi:hypothetical protein
MPVKQLPERDLRAVVVNVMMGRVLFSVVARKGMNIQEFVRVIIIREP